MAVRGVLDPHNLTLRMPRELISPNKWQGRHWTVKHRLSQTWEQELVAAFLGGRTERPLPMVCVEKRKVRVLVVREVPSRRNFIRDDDNLRFSVKPLLDALKRGDFIRDDSREWIELPTPEQRISSDGKHWTIVELKAV